MADAQTEKYSNPKYNKDEFLDDLIKKEIEGSDIKGDVVIIDGWAFELDRSVPNIGKDLGQADKLVFPQVTVSEAQLADNYRTATFSVTALEETNGINKIEIWLNGEKLETYDKTYSNIKTEVRENFTVNRNGVYTIKVYGELMISKTVEVEGIVPAVKFSPNGSTEWKKEHSTTITVEQTGETVTEIKYLWKTGENEPQASEFKETCTDNNTITGKELTGKYHLWILLKTDNDKINICGSEEFYFDNQGPNITAFTPAKHSIDGITMSATAQDTGFGTIRFEFYVDDELKDTQTCDVTTESVTKTSIPITGLTTGNHNCKVIVYDAEENSSTKTASGTTKLYSWLRYDCAQIKTYESYLHNEGRKLLRSEAVISGLSSVTVDEDEGGFHCKCWGSGLFEYMSVGSLFTEEMSSGGNHTPSYSEVINVDDKYYTCNVYRTRAIYKYVKGNGVGRQVTSTEKNTYPNKERHTDGYWYEYVGIE